MKEGKAYIGDEKQVEWIIEQHVKTNHFYDTYLPYEFHLRMVVSICSQFNYLNENHWSDIVLACWGHDLIEDTRVSYNDCNRILGEYVANIIYAVTNEKGKNRKERANEKYYAGIRNIPGASFVKICDRIANIQYSQLTKSGMYEMYKSENEKFIFYLGDEKLRPILDYMQSLFNNNQNKQS